jgi:dTMP kinase
MTQVPGLFISLEGIDGSGKSTQARLLAEALRGLGRDPVLTREPGGAPGRRISAACWWRATPPAGRPRPRSCCSPPRGAITWNARSAPRWRAGQDVITDRFADSTRVYQGATRGDLRGLVDTIHDAAIGVEPDLTLILDMDPATALDRGLARSSGEDRFEEFGLEFQQKLRAGFLAPWRRSARALRLIDATGATDTIAARILARPCKRGSEHPRRPAIAVLHRGA